MTATDEATAGFATRLLAAYSTIGVLHKRRLPPENPKRRRRVTRHRRNQRRQATPVPFVEGTTVSCPGASAPGERRRASGETLGRRYHESTAFNAPPTANGSAASTEDETCAMPTASTEGDGGWLEELIHVVRSQCIEGACMHRGQLEDPMVHEAVVAAQAGSAVLASGAPVVQGEPTTSHGRLESTVQGPHQQPDQGGGDSNNPSFAPESKATLYLLMTVSSGTNNRPPRRRPTNCNPREALHMKPKKCRTVSWTGQRDRAQRPTQMSPGSTTQSAASDRRTGPRGQHSRTGWVVECGTILRGRDHNPRATSGKYA